MAHSQENTENNSESLPYPLDEFREALRQEITATKQNVSNTAVPLKYGRKLSSQGAAYQYAFQLETILNTPDGTPADLLIPGKETLSATIVSFQGLQLILSVEKDLGPFIPEASLQTDLTFLLRKLIERIEQNSEKINPAAARMLGKKTVTGTPQSPRESFIWKNHTQLSDDQMRALHSALGRNLTVIWGPPGTGKTHTIGTITEQLFALGRTVLIVSHTNTAVDQAIKHVANSMNQYLENGAVIRIGEVKDSELNTQFPDVLIKQQVERQSQALIQQKDKLNSQRESIAESIDTVQEKIAIIEWIKATEPELKANEKALTHVRQREEQLTADQEKLSLLEQKRENLVNNHKLASEAIEKRNALTEKNRTFTDLASQLSRINQKLIDEQNHLLEQKQRAKTAERIEPLKQERKSYPSREEQRQVIQTLATRKTEQEERLQALKDQQAIAKSVLTRIRKSTGVGRVLKRLPKLDEQASVVSNLNSEVATVQGETASAHEAYQIAKKKLSRILEIDAELSSHENLRTPSEEKHQLKQIQESITNIETNKNRLKESEKKVKLEIENLKEEEKLLNDRLEHDASEVFKKADAQLKQLNTLQKSVTDLSSEITVKRRDIVSRLTKLLRQAESWTTSDSSVYSKSAEEMLASLQSCHSNFTKNYSVSELDQLLEKLRYLEDERRKVSADINEIEQKLAQVENEIVKNAHVIGATITKSYLSDDIQGRNFDTVILDEASMAPIPALWVAALLSSSNLVIVGDFRQLPPIVQSEAPAAKKWLGQDIFEVSGLKSQWESGTNPEYFIPLSEQRRMLPELATVSNLFYSDLGLKTNLSNSANTLPHWYNTGWRHHDKPVLLIDTGSLNAWVTNVVRGAGTSRLNFLSAVFTVDLAEQLISPNINEQEKGTKHILIVSPYRPHAKLVSLLINENTVLQEIAVSGTIHSFQGSEADVVIFDLVADEPQWRVNLFNPQIDEEIKRQLNVALTRSKHRLFIVGDFSYCKQKGKNAFLGRELLPFLLKNFSCVDAAEIASNDLADKAARSDDLSRGAAVPPELKGIITTQNNFFQFLSRDIKNANNRIIIYSPFLARDRLDFIKPQLRAAANRNVLICVITKPPSEFSTIPGSRKQKMENELSSMGATVFHKMRMHEKLILIDDNITWTGSLNPLSHSTTQEIMERRESKTVFNSYFETLKLYEFLDISNTPAERCPICNSEMIAMEDRNDVFYWRCIKGCYARRIGEEYPANGVLTCSSNGCNAPLKFGYWGNTPCWRCTVNNRHHRKLRKSHLRLPKMVSLIPEDAKPKVCKVFNIDNLDEYCKASPNETPDFFQLME